MTTPTVLAQTWVQKYAARQKGLLGIDVSAESAGEAAVVEDIQVIAVDRLAQAVAFFAGQLDIDHSRRDCHC